MRFVPCAVVSNVCLVPHSAMGREYRSHGWIAQHSTDVPSHWHGTPSRGGLLVSDLPMFLYFSVISPSRCAEGTEDTLRKEEEEYIAFL